MKNRNEPASTSSEEWLQAIGGEKIVNLAGWILLAGALIYVALLPDLGRPDDRRLIGPAFLLPASIVSLLLVRAGKTRPGYHLLLWSVLLGITVAGLLVAGLRTGIVFAYPALVVLALVLGPRMLVAYGASAIAAVIGLGLAEQYGLPAAPLLPSTFTLGLIDTLVLAILTIVAAAIGRAQQRWRDRAALADRSLRHGLQALAERERDLRQIMNNLPAGICAFEGWNCRFANAHLAAYCGFSEETIVGKHLREVLGDTHFALARPHVEQVLAGKPVRYHGPHPSPAAAGRFMMFLLVPVTRERGGEAGFYGIFFDVTRQERARLEVEQLNRELDRRVRDRTAELASANRELESFAYSVSHDLRAPLRGIDGFSLLAIEEYGDRLGEQGRGYLERVRAAAQRMGLLIDDILELSRVARQEMRQERVDLGRLASELLDELRRADAQRSVEVAIMPECIATGDSRLLRVLLQNLLENAWKYTAHQPAARIEFGGETLATGETAYFVRDNGAGFDMQYAGRLFTPFQRLHSPKEYPGSGVGLATVARIVHRHGGRVWAEAEPKKGATFRFTLGALR